MGNYSDLEIAQKNNMEKIEKVAKEVGLSREDIELYGDYKAKVKLSVFDDLKVRENGKLILVTAMTPTPAGEGKTTVTVGIGDALRRIGKQSIIALREPSLGPVFGIKGGAAGGGYSQVVPMEDINLHFTGDIHAIGAANNLLAAMLDNHIKQGNILNIDPRRITWKRSIDMNDRQLRSIVDGIGGIANGVPRQDGFDITVASEVMAIVCLASGISDLKTRLSKIIIGYTYDNEPVTAGQLHAEGAMTALLIDAIKPNLVQTLEKTPALIHGGPFANIAHGCNSIMATTLGLKLGDYCVTEAGFGADLGAEKFLDIKCRVSGLKPNAIVLVASVRALKHHGGVEKSKLEIEDLNAIKHGFSNLKQHIKNLKEIYNVPVTVAINKFPSDTEKELDYIKDKVTLLGVSVHIIDVWSKGGEGGIKLAEDIVNLCEQDNPFHFCYDENLSIEDKITAIAKKIYHADGVEFIGIAKKQLKQIEELGFNNLPICIAKTQYSFSDNPKLLKAPSGFTISIRSLKISAGAGFIVVLTGDVMTMPGLPKVPSSEKIDVDETGKITGLF